MITATEIAKIMSKLSVDEKSSDRIAKMVAEKYPEKLPAIIRTLERMRDLDADFVTVKTVRRLTEAEKSEIETSLGSKAGHKLSFSYLLDDKMKGGIIIQKGEKVIDNSLTGRINKVQQKIREINLNQE